jgi:hypothetical protein
VELVNPKIELRDVQEQDAQFASHDQEAWFGVRIRIMEAAFRKTCSDIGPEVKLFYGVAPSPEKVQYG